MRPIRLTLEGFTSFRTHQSLDFSTLDLFAITGLTGAGKSSLLDAITYALYGKVSRKSNIDELVSQGATELKVEFQFSVQQTEYKVLRTWRYRPSTPVTKCLLDKLQDGKWERCDRTVKVEDILMMDFDTFTRVIVLPQGQFDEFLKGNPPKRRELLRQLAGFEIFERMRKEASERVKQLDTQRKLMEGQLESLQAPTEAEIKEKQEQLKALEDEIPQLAQAATTAQKLLDDEERLLTQIKRQAELQEDLATLEAQAPKIASLQQKLKEAQSASTLQSDWILLQDARNQAVKAENAVKAAAEKLTQAQADLEAQHQKYELFKSQQTEVREQLEIRERNLTTAKAYEEQRQQYEQEVTQASKTFKSKEQQRSDAEKELQSAQKKEKAARAQLTETNEKLAKSSPGGSRLEILNQVVSPLTQWETINKTTQTARKKWEKALKERQKAESDFKKATSQRQQADANFQAAKAALKEAEQANTIATRHNHSAALRASLQPGELCSVCGGVYPEAHQLPPLSESAEVDTTPLQESATAAEQAYHQASTALTKAQTKLETLQEQESECRQDWESHEAELIQCHAEISAVLDTENWEISALKQAHQTLIESNAQHQEALAAQAKTANELEKWEQTLQFVQKNHAAVLEDVQATSQEVEHRQRNLKEVQAKLHQLTEGKPYEILRQALKRDKQDLESKQKAVEESYQAADKRVAQAEEADKQARVAAESTRAKRQQLEAQWEKALQSVNFSEESFLDAQVTPAEQEKWKNAIAHYNNEKVALSSRIKEVTSSIGDRTTDEELLEQRRQVKCYADEQVDLARSQRAELSAEMNVALDRQQQAKQLLEQQSTLAAQEQTYHTLSRNLKSDEFQDYILEHLQAELVACATERLKELTDSRYALRIQDGEYWVEDNWNGGEIRRVRTLSGGETFATSLSMALALSEKLSMGVELGSLFLDEGFGTLDAETLESVTQILRSLGQQDRLIGVITHIRALAEQLPTQIKVHKSPEGSRLVVEAF
ncbi:SMC family ATPase [Microcoleus sp. FACHB-SPT15]|uniref:AAA family ATPase n=1 Tax=Microcoleus sp. FACHB-SPT15 TaxID=2692830 RepID=UPI0017838EA9|nr:SMC family ATPase [Microcoleus sp. FACHB-SPT15]MBD1806428.1 SMC family ATPase [Microcoleus sp. FACHB-SPT15]